MRWNALLDAESGYMNGAELASVSVKDWKRYEDTHVNWRVVEGYGAAIAAFGAGLPIRLGCAVTLIDHARRVASRSKPRRAGSPREAVIVTAPPPLIAAEAIAFRPALPDKIDAAAVLPLGLADKLVMTVDAPDLPAGGHLFGDPARDRDGELSSAPIRPASDRGFFWRTSRSRTRKRRHGRFLRFRARRTRPPVRQRLRAPISRPLSETAWASDPWSRGAYSHALPGHADARATLAAPVDDRLFFAGEACSKHSFSTAHGAYLTGLEAAEARHRGAAAKARADKPAS